MKIKILRIAQSAVFFAVIGLQKSDVEATNNTLTFFKEMDTVMISSRTAHLVILLESVVLKMGLGDRPVRRYFDSYSTPFHGSEKIVSSSTPASRREQAF